MLQVQFLGDLILYWAQVPHSFTTLPKVVPLLAYLLLHRQQPVDRNRLAFTLWPDVTETAARSNLRRHLYELGRALPDGATDWLRRVGNEVQWNPLAPYWLDVAAFEEAVQNGRLAEAAQLYSGHLLPLVDEPWLYVERERVRNLFLLTLQQLIEQQQQNGRYAEALVTTQRLLSFDPLREDGQRQLMRLRYALGDRAGALQAYQQFADLLDRELGVPPMPDTKQVRDQIVANTPLAQLLPQPQTASIAIHHSPFTIHHSQLPQPLRPLIGRQPELTDLTQLIIGRGRRLVTLTGPSGIGKSRLALALAHKLATDHRDHFPDGLYFVPLAVLTDPEQVLTAVAARLNIRLHAGSDPLAVLVDSLRYKRLFLLLDNLEHLLPAAVHLSTLLQAVPGLTILTTSQSPLQLYGEQTYSLPGLPLPPLSPLPPLAELARNESVALFQEAAQAANPRFRLTAANAMTVARICHRLDGLPLAIELAAARSSLLSPADILDQLEDMLAFLATPARDVAARHRSMEAALQWSYDLLAENEQAVFAALSVFVDTFDLAAAAAVCGLDRGQTAVFLDALLTKNLIQTAVTDNQSRLEMLFTIRAFAQAKLRQSGDETVARDRHAAYFAGLCHFSSSDPIFNMGAHLARLAEVQADLLTAVGWLTGQTHLSDEQQAQLGWLLRVLPQLYFRYGRVGEGITWLDQVEKSLNQLPLPEQPAILSQFAALVRESGDYARSAACLDRALVLAEQLQNHYLMSRVLLHLGALAGIREEYEQAVALTEQAIGLDEGMRSGPMTAEKVHWWQNRAIDLKYLGRYEEALALLAEARGFLERQGDQMSLAGNQHSVAGIYLMQEQYEAAGQWYEMARKTAVAAKYPRLIWLSLRGLAQVAAETSDWAEAVRLYSQANQLALTLGFSPIPVARRQEEDYLAQARQTLSPAAYREAWLHGEQTKNSREWNGS
jgi:predicted ATPase/DNA-binding SARP family transcriptional activator